MKNASVIKAARNGDHVALYRLPIRYLTDAIVALEYKRLTEDGFTQSEADALYRLHEVRCLLAEQDLAGYVSEAAQERAL